MLVPSYENTEYHNTDTQITRPTINNKSNSKAIPVTGRGGL
jgi:hypothetical protein